MNRDQALGALKAHERELRADGVESISIFGSVARQEDSAHDIDVAVRLGQGFSEPGLDYFSRLDRLEQRLTQMLGCKVDVVEEPVRKERFQREIDRIERLPSEHPSTAGTGFVAHAILRAVSAIVPTPAKRREESRRGTQDCVRHVLA